MRVTISQYQAGRPILSNFSVEIPAGTSVALVGPTGAGKSTLVSLIPRFVDPWEGRVTIDGIDVLVFDPHEHSR